MDDDVAATGVKEETIDASAPAGAKEKRLAELMSVIRTATSLVHFAGREDEFFSIVRQIYFDHFAGKHVSEFYAFAGFVLCAAEAIQDKAQQEQKQSVQ